MKDGVQGHFIRYCEARPAEGCRTCPAEDLDAEVLETAKKYCDQPIEGLQRGCYIETTTAEFEMACCYEGYFYSDCVINID